MYNEEEMKLMNKVIEELQGKIVQSSATNATAGVGWICPVCGRGLSPFTTFCPCKGYIKYDIECLY